MVFAAALSSKAQFDVCVDALVTGSQKALMLPPGLAMIALSERALARAREVKTPRFYFDLPRELRLQRDEHTTAWTPAVSLVFGLNKSLEMIHAENERLPVDAVTQKLAFLGRTGSGKTYGATKLAELMLGAGAQIVALGWREREVRGHRVPQSNRLARRSFI